MYTWLMNIIPSILKALGITDDIARLDSNIVGHAFIDMDNDDYVMNRNEVRAALKVVLNAGDGTKKLIVPAEIEAEWPINSMVTGLYAGNDFILRMDSTEAEITFPSGEYIAVITGLV